jgi:hypothetical protein
MEARLSLSPRKWMRIPSSSSLSPPWAPPWWMEISKASSQQEWPLRWPKDRSKHWIWGEGCRFVVREDETLTYSWSLVEESKGKRSFCKSFCSRIAYKENKTWDSLLLLTLEILPKVGGRACQVARLDLPIGRFNRPWQRLPAQAWAGGSPTRFSLRPLVLF